MFVLEAMVLTLFAIFVLGVLIGGQINRGIYRLAFDKRSIGPWSSAADKTPPRAWYDRVPIVGWFGLRRESDVHGSGYWIRPMLIEVAIGVGFSALYWAVVNGALLPTPFDLDAGRLQELLHAQFLSMVTLISLMVVATFIDFDEQTIPDSITVPGALLGLGFAWALPQSRLMTAVRLENGTTLLEPLHLGSPNAYPVWLDGTWGLAAGLGVYLLWCFSILDRRWITRKGLSKAIGFFIHGIARNPYSIRVALLGVAGSAAISAAWFGGGSSGRSLISALIGMGCGGGIVWAIRVIGKAALHREAMGFGDVTLMAMIGAFLGWQPAALVFFLAPFSAVVIAVVQAVAARRAELAFGPYLCLAALLVLISWGRLWPNWAVDIFQLGPFLAALFIFLLGLMYVLLLAMRLLRGLVQRPG